MIHEERNNQQQNNDAWNTTARKLFRGDDTEKIKSSSHVYNYSIDLGQSHENPFDHVDYEERKI